MTTAEVMNKAQAEAHEWLETVRTQFGLSNERSALAVLRAGLHVLRDAVPAGEAVNLGNSLPMLIRGVYYEGWSPKSVLAKTVAVDIDVAKSVQHDIRGHEELPSAEKALLASFRALDGLLRQEALEPVLNALPKSVRELWPAREKGGGEPAPGR